MGRRTFLSLIALLFPARAFAERPPMPVGDPVRPPKPVGPPVAKSPRLVGFRNPVGHTHTCPAGHTWDHRMNSGHTCIAPVVRDGKIAQCGLQEFDKDSPPRMVGIYSTDKPAVEAVVESQPTVTYTLPGALSGGCSSGNCPTTTVRRWRW